MRVRIPPRAQAADISGFFIGRKSMKEDIQLKAEDFDLPEYESWAPARQPKIQFYTYNNWYTTTNSSTSTDTYYYIPYTYGYSNY